jgi:hypothetical protein
MINKTWYFRLFFSETMHRFDKPGIAGVSDTLYARPAQPALEDAAGMGG